MHDRRAGHDISKYLSRASERQKRTLLSAQPTGRQMQSAVPMQRLKPAHLPYSEAVKDPHYHTLFEASGGRLPVPRPFHQVGSLMKVAYPRVSTANYPFSILPGQTRYIYLTPYHGTRAFSIATPNASIVSSVTNAVSADPFPTDTINDGANWAQGLIATMNPLLNGGANDVYGIPSVNALAVSDMLFRSTAVPYAQLLGGEATLEVATNFEGQATIFAMPHGYNASISGNKSVRLANVQRNLDVPGFNGIISLPSVETSSLSMDRICATYGTRSLLGGNAVRHQVITLPHDRSWYHLGAVAAASDTTVNASSKGWEPTRNPLHALQYGVFAVINSGPSTITCNFHVQATYCVTWADTASETLAQSDPLRASLLQKAKALLPNWNRSAPTGVSSRIGNGSPNITTQSAIQMRDDSHHDSLEATAATTASGAALEYQTGAVTKTANKLKSILNAPAAAKTETRMVVYDPAVAARAEAAAARTGLWSRVAGAAEQLAARLGPELAAFL